MNDGIAAHVPIREVCAVLVATYGNPRLGNWDNPLDELVYIILSNRTGEQACRAAFQRLRTAYPDWNALELGDLERTTEMLAPGGFGRLKAQQIASIFDRLRNTFGRVTLDPLFPMTTDDAEAFLRTLPGVAAKVAKCVLMYSLGRPVLPVDVHVHRVARRLGLRVKKRPDTSQELIEAAVPPELRYGFHVNCIAHGRKICVARMPKCASCPLARWCRYYATQYGDTGAEAFLASRNGTEAAADPTGLPFKTSSIY